MLLAIIGWRTTATIKSASNIIFRAPYGFEKGGSAQIKLSNLDNEGLFALGVCSEIELSNISRRYDLTCNSLINSCKHTEMLSSDNKQVYFNDTIEKAGLYKTLILQCAAGASYASQYTVELTYKNKKSFMSTDRIPCLYEKPVLAVIFFLAVVYWYANWILNYKATGPLHVFFTCAISFSLICIITDMSYYIHYHKSDKDIGVTTASTVFNLIFKLLFSCGLMLICRGFGVIHNDFTKWQVLQTCGITILTVASLNSFTYIENIWASFVLFIIFLVSFFFLLRIMMNGIKDAMLHIIAHMYVIAKKGIAPATTPVMDKYKLYNRVNYILVGYMAINVIVQFVSAFTYVDIWISELIQDITNAVLLYGTVWLFRLKSQAAQGYQSIENGDPPQEFTREDVERMNIDEIIRSATEPYDGQTALPAQPIIVDTPTVRVNEDDDIQEDDIIPDNNLPDVAPIRDDGELETI